MSTLTKEWLLKTIAELEEERDAVPGVVNEDAAKALAAMKLALASLEAEKGAEPVAKVETVGVCWYADNGVPRKPAVGTELFAAPPAPVAMKDHQIRDLVNELRDIAVEYYGTQQLRERIAKTVRAAMLQGAEPVTTAYKLPFEQWLSQQTGTIDVECGCVMTEVFFHWLRVAYEAGNSPVIPDGYALVPVEPTTNQWAAGMQAFDSGMDKVTRVYKAMLAAAPQQEVK
ncbi:MULTISPECIES: hypothetical protein [Enterobacter cloacae complex]|uniref:hypothetical protein n=1 Tax=Enterobacter cloacae complex TaxID=354276 RepID=UPI003204F90C